MEEERRDKRKTHDERRNKRIVAFVTTKVKVTQNVCNSAANEFAL